MRENMKRETKRRRSEAPLRLVMRQPDDWHVHLRDGEMIVVHARDPRGVRVRSGDEIHLGRAVLRIEIR